MISFIKKYALAGLAIATSLFYAFWQISRGKRAKDKANLAEAVTKQTEKSDQALIDGLQNEQNENQNAKKADIDTIIDHYS
ncbi:MAG: hypothetical protein GY941_15740 [Planctomycetes bacterium]|nr:hypothetical protein [Planctomycetota bacterium]